jgi:hypothetical protein
MKRSLIILASLLAIAALILPVAAKAASTAGSWNGWITDASCGARGANAAHKACAEKCAKDGSKLVLYNTGDQKIYRLDKQDVAKQHVGEEVTVTGKVDGNTIAVDSIAAKKAS